MRLARGGSRHSCGCEKRESHYDVFEEVTLSPQLLCLRPLCIPLLLYNPELLLQSQARGQDLHAAHGTVQSTAWQRTAPELTPERDAPND